MMPPDEGTPLTAALISALAELAASSPDLEVGGAARLHERLVRSAAPQQLEERLRATRDALDSPKTAFTDTWDASSAFLSARERALQAARRALHHCIRLRRPDLAAVTALARESMRDGD